MIQTVWIEIPVRDIERALAFYRTLFDLGAIEITDDGVRKTATLFYDHESKHPGISLNQTRNFEPGDKGIYLYLNCGEDLTDHLNRIEPAGGKILERKTSMGAAGHYASVLDTEGNLIGLYSPR